MRFKWDFDYIKLSRLFFSISIFVTVAGIISLFVLGLNYSVDFRSGSNVDVVVSKPVPKEQLDAVIHTLSVKQEPSVTLGQDRINIRFPNVLTEVQETKFKQQFKDSIDKTAVFEINTVDPEMAKELERNAIYAVLIASIGIMLYIAVRFEWRFGVAAVLAVFHDAFIVISIFSLFRLHVDLTFITAVLTIVGFSINDTIVIFDRIRENLRFAKQKTKLDLAKIVNDSISQTMTRSIHTTLTVFIAALCLYLFGGPSIHMFSLAMVIGLVFGAYSSIFIASPLWYVLKGMQKSNANRTSS